MERRSTDKRRAPKRRAPRRVPGQPGSASALRAVVETVRRVMRADTASVASISHADRTITWAATSGFQAREDARAGALVLPLRGVMAERAAAAEELIVLAGIGLSEELPAAEFPLHAAEGVRDVALVPLRARGERLGVLVVGYRAAHEFSADERQTLEGLAEMAALALDNARLVEIVGASKRIWEQTFDAIPDGIIVHDAALRVTRCNATAADALGLDAPVEAIGLPCADVFARLFGERAAAFYLSRTPGAATSFEIQAEDRRRYLVAVAPLLNPEAGGWHAETKADEQERAGTTATDAQARPSTAALSSWSVITWSDVTDLSEVQEQLARSRRLATTGQLAAGVAHEINNPLAAVTTCAEAALRDLRAAPADVRAFAAERNWPFYLEEIVRQALRCKAITRGLLDLARQRRARREPCDLNGLVARATVLHAQRASERGVTLDTKLDADVGEVATDEAMVRQVLDNLLTNALDAAGTGGRVAVTTSAQEPRVVVEVADTGPGIAPELLTRIFDPFFTTKEAGQGSGLGLAISTTLAEALGGALTVESKRGAGSRFRLWLPRHAPEG